MSHWVTSNISKAYAGFRPNYPKELFEHINKEFGGKNKTATVAIDVGCGTGQATVPLANIFGHVIGVDPSESQIETAITKSQERTAVTSGKHNTDNTTTTSIDFVVGSSDSFDAVLSSPANTKADFISVFQAAHWFDIPKFAQACHRAAKTTNSNSRNSLSPSTSDDDATATVALVTYAILKTPQYPLLSASISSMDRMLHEKKYWPVERKLIDQRYAPIIEEMNRNGWVLHSEKEIQHKYDVTVAEFVGYLKTFSALIQYQRKHSDGAGMDLVIKRYITSVLKAEIETMSKGNVEKNQKPFANHIITDEDLMKMPIQLEFPVIAFFFKQQETEARNGRSASSSAASKL